MMMDKVRKSLLDVRADTSPSRLEVIVMVTRGDWSTGL